MAEEVQARAKKVEANPVVCIWRGSHEHVRWKSREIQNTIGGNTTAAVPGETIHPGDNFTPTNREAYSFRNLIELNGKRLDMFSDDEMKETFGLNETDPEDLHLREMRNSVTIFGG